MDLHYRYFALNVCPNDVAPETLLALVRMMWRVEVFHNDLSQYMRIKAGDWVRQGQGPAVVAALCALALNFLLLFQQRRLRKEGWRDELTLPQLMQIFMIVIAAGAISPLLKEKEKSRNAQPEDELSTMTKEELVEAYFAGEELELMAMAFRNLVRRIIRTATGWVTQQTQRLTKLISRLKEQPLLQS